MKNQADATADGESGSERKETGGISEAQVVEYLKEHPDFFMKERELLEDLNLPHSSGQTISLVERQVGILRERNVEVRRRANELLEAARVNDQLFEKTRTLTLALLDAGSMRELNEVLATHLLVDFNADFVCCHVTGSYEPLDHFSVHEEIPFRSLLNAGRATCTTLRSHELEQVFPNGIHGDAGSAVLIPIEGTESILAVGSRDPAHFAPDMDTLFVTYMAQILGKVISHLTET